MSYDTAAVRSQFPALQQQVHEYPLVYLDNAATTQKPQSVLDTVAHYYEHDNANVHRGVHALSQRATDSYEGARQKVADFVGGGDPKEIVFVRGTTEAINLVAQSFVRPKVGPGDEILITTMEHHSNIVPWQMVCQATGAELKVAAIKDDGSLDMDNFESKLSKDTAFVSVTHVSNALGTVNPVKDIVGKAHAVDAEVLIDGAQAAPHEHVDVSALGADFYAISGHKMYAPTGIGALWAKAEHLEAMPPYQGGGDMITSVSFEKTTYNDIPYKFEAGTPNIGGAIGLGAACDFLTDIGVDNIAVHEETLLAYATTRFEEEIDGGRIIGTAPHKAAVLSYELEGIHPHDIGTLMDRHGVAIRTGHHCAQPVMQRFGVPATSRASLGCYNDREDIDAWIAATKTVKEIFLIDELRDLYQQVIMDHNKSPRNFHRLDHADASVDGHNPLCGDSLTVDVRFDGDKIAEIGWEGVGCAISKSSASLMTEAVKGKDKATAKALYEQFHHLVTRDAPVDPEELGKLRAFAGVGEFPARVKCATLAWRTLAAAIEGEADSVSTED